MAPQTARELVQLAQTNLHKLRYLNNLPDQMVSTVDTALIVEDATYPVHSFILMSASPIFADMVASHYAEAINGKAPAPLAIPLLGSRKKETQSALQFIYQHCLLSKDKTLPLDVKLEEAECMVEFGHKWNMQLLLQAGDRMLCNQIARQCGSGPSSIFGATLSEKAVKVIAWAVRAETMALPKSLAFCERWLVLNFNKFADAHTELFHLGQQSMLRVMTGLADRAGSWKSHMEPLDESSSESDDTDEEEDEE